MEIKITKTNSKWDICCGYSCKGLLEFTIDGFTQGGHKYYRIKPGTLQLYISTRSGPDSLGSYGVEHYCEDCMKDVLNKIRVALNPSLKVLL